MGVDGRPTGDGDQYWDELSIDRGEYEFGACSWGGGGGQINDL